MRIISVETKNKETNRYRNIVDLIIYLGKQKVVSKGLDSTRTGNKNITHTVKVGKVGERS